MSKLSISLVTFNSEQHVRDFCDSLKVQTFTDWELIVIDNHSADQSVSIIQESLPNAKISRQGSNLGFSRAHNLGISWSSGDYVLIVNPDVVFHPYCLEQLVRAIDRHHEVACVGPKLLSWHTEDDATNDIIDSAGLELHKTYQVTDRFQGRQDSDMQQKNVFGISGAFALFRKAALEDVRVPRSGTSVFEYFDEDFFAYKEDADLSWRLLSRGWKHLFVPSAIAYHKRTLSGRSNTWFDRRQRKSLNELSYRNHVAMIYKNHSWAVSIRLLPRIVIFEVAKFFYLLFLDRSSVRGLLAFVRDFSKYRSKRKYIQSLRRVTHKQFREYIT